VRNKPFCSQKHLIVSVSFFLIILDKEMFGPIRQTVRDLTDVDRDPISESEGRGDSAGNMFTALSEPNGAEPLISIKTHGVAGFCRMGT